ncbi:BACON domain-containing protein, partial [Bacteroides caecigallinarum]
MITLLCSCSKEEDNVARAVLSSTSSLNFPAQKPTEKMITVYSDAEWFMEELPEWITVTPTTGSGTTEVTISVSENMRDGSIDNPRNATVVFRGRTLASRAEVKVTQEGDIYRDCKEYSVSDAVSLEDGTVVIVPNAYVSAVTSSGGMITDTDAANNIYIETSENIKVGDEVYIMGTKESDTYKLSS